MAPLVTLCVLLLLGALGRAQSTRQAQQGAHRAPMLPPLPLGDPGSEADLPQFLRSRHAGHLTAENTYSYMNKDSNRVGLLVVAAAGVVSLMAAVYCIYNKFYTKQQYLHTPLQEHPELTFEPPENPPMMLAHGPMGDGRERPAGYGSLSISPSVICVPPSLSPPPPPPPPRRASPSPFPPPYPSSRTLRTISARDLEKNFL